VGTSKIGIVAPPIVSTSPYCATRRAGTSGRARRRRRDVSPTWKSAVDARARVDDDLAGPSRQRPSQRERVELRLRRVDAEPEVGLPLP
jgi:hypothetical protein